MERFPFGSETTPTVEVRIFRDGRLVHRELCESDADVAEVLARWDGPGVTSEVDDLGPADQSLGDADRFDEVAPSLAGDDDYPRG